MSAATQEHENRVLGGYKGTLHNPAASEEAKEHAAEVLRAHEVDISQPVEGSLPAPHASSHTAQDGVAHDHRVLGGYKAALHNPSVSCLELIPQSKLTDEVSEEAKVHAAEVLQAHGVEVPKEDLKHAHPGEEGKEHTAEELKHEHHVLGGYKATLHNPNASDEAKEHAREVLAAADEQ